MNVRRQKLLTHIDPRGQRGVEIGALDRPTITRDEGDIRYVDFTTTDELRKQRANDQTVELARLVEVDHVWGDQTLSEALGGAAPVDYVIASHVIEHVPDLIGWLKEIGEVLKPGGVASFVVPDKRYTFDRLRPETRAPEVVEAHLLRRRKPSVRQLYEHFGLHTRVDLGQAWAGTLDDGDLVRVHDDAHALAVCQEAVASGRYVDCHCWVFTPSSFFGLLRVLIDLGLFDFRVAAYSPPQPNEIDFFVSLARVDDALPLKARQALQLESLPQVLDAPVAPLPQAAPPASPAGWPSESVGVLLSRNLSELIADPTVGLRKVRRIAGLLRDRLKP